MALARSRIRGSLLGCAVGDSLGARSAAGSRREIRHRRRPGSPEPLPRDVGHATGVTEETQLTLFTAEGLVLAARDRALAGRSGAARSVHRAYLRWLKTQGEHSTHPTFERTAEGWLLSRPELHERRVTPRSVAVTALRGRRMGRFEQPINNSKGCSALVRVAAVGLASGVGDPFGVAREIAALLHGHPTACLAAGFFALAIREACAGTPLRAACSEALEELRRQPGNSECLETLERALTLAAKSRQPPGSEDLAALGSGQAAHEALAVALCCSLAAPDFESALRLAVTCRGRSNTTGALTGSLLGAAGGERVIPALWLEQAELRGAIERTAEELMSSVEEGPARGRE